MLGNLASYTCKRTKVEHFLTLYKKINSKWIKDPDVRPETIKILEENIGRTLLDISCSNNFLDLSPKAKERKAKTKKWDIIKPQGFCTAKKTIDKKTAY